MAENIMFVVKKRVTMTMATDIMLKNGTVVMVSGSIITKAGKKHNSKMAKA